MDFGEEVGCPRERTQASCLGMISMTTQHMAAVAAMPARAVKLIVITTDIGVSRI